MPEVNASATAASSDGTDGAGEPWRREELVLIVPPEHPWAGCGVIELEQLRGCQLLGGESGSGTSRVIQEQLADIAPSLQVAAQLGSTEAVKRAVQAGMGVSLVLTASVEREVAAGWLDSVRIAGRCDPGKAVVPGVRSKSVTGQPCPVLCRASAWGAVTMLVAKGNHLRSYLHADGDLSPDEADGSWIWLPSCQFQKIQILITHD